MDSANRTFLIMILLTIFFFGLTTFQMFFRSSDLTDAEKTASSAVSVPETENNSTTAIRLGNDTLENFQIISQKTKIEEELFYENNKIKVVFDWKTGEIKQAFIKYGKNNQKFDIVGSKDGFNALVLRLGSWDKGVSISQLVNNNDPIYQIEQKGNIYRFFTELKSNHDDLIYKIEKIYTFIEDEYLFKVDFKISNNQNIPIRFDSSDKSFSIGWGPALGIKSMADGKKDPRYDQFRYLSSSGKIVNMGEKNKILKGVGYAEINKGPRDSWVSSDSHYFTTVILPDGNDYNYFFDYRKTQNDISYCGFSLLSEKSVIDTTFHVYIGPKTRSILKRYNDFKNSDVYISKAELTKLDPPIIWGVGDILGYILHNINKVVRNYGISIVIITILLKLLIAPLTHKSMLSQQKMQKLQPKMKELQEKYKDKPDLLNKKTMELYQKEGISPLAGCLPLLLQMPLLFAMYQLLDRMVELKGASFLWIKDLAMPDAIFQFGFTIPLLNSNTLNILPIIMVLTQIAQSFMTPEMKNNPQTKMMVWMMPIIFFFFFYNVSSGLVLYWTVMNLLGILQQFFLNQHNKKCLVTQVK